MTLEPYLNLLILMAVIPFVFPLAALIYRGGIRLSAYLLMRRQLRIVGDLGVDELALAACETHLEQLELIDGKLRDEEALQLMRPKPGRAEMLLRHRHWVNEWLWQARKAQT